LSISHSIKSSDCIERIYTAPTVVQHHYVQIYT
jgi:hypothetical protein